MDDCNIYLLFKEIRLVMLGLVVLTSASSFATSLATQHCHQLISRLNTGPWCCQFKKWLDLCLPAGIVSGCLMSWLPLRFLGRRATLQLVVAPLLCAGCCLSFMFQHVMLPALLLAVWLQGMAAGVNFTAVPVYVLETMTRPALPLIISTQTSVALGTLLACVLALTSHTTYLPLLPAAIIATSSFCLCFVMESPRWLLLFGKKIEQAKSSLYILHKCNEPDYNVCKALVNYRKQEQEFCERITNLQTIKIYTRALSVSMFLMTIPCVTGVHAYRFYADWVYRHSSVQAVLQTYEQVIGVAIATTVVSVTGGIRSQYVTLIVSVSTMSLVLGATGLCLFSIEQTENWIWAVPWLPLALHWMFQIAFWSGIGSQTFVVAFESVPPPIRPSVFSLSGGLHWLLQAMSQKFLVFMLDIVQPFGTFFFHAGVSTVVLVLIVFVVIPTIKHDTTCNQIEKQVQDISTDK
ncbi:hypothetical protein L9F63_013831 [Diploptera punctata]|uniref:Major facilitator superfamily (MFS) profile domain-containing protein n=1 Tax=Diploptera punctata TaxID=6984 RepID=A0AAD8AA37_DIPPU|nr:hypothetical protein L9F63_013831 [Diploptera punctata]